MHVRAVVLAIAAVVQCIHAGFEGVHLSGVNYNSRKGQDWQPVNEKCKDYNAIVQDLYTLKTITNRIRIYSLVDCPVLPVIDAAKTAGMQVALGIWTTSNPQQVTNEKNVLQSLITAGKIDSNIVGLHVGSEAIYRKDITAAQAIAYLNQVRTLLQQNGIYNLPLTIADVVDSYMDHPELVDAVDLVSVNQFSFWEPRKSTIDTAVARLLERLRSVRGLAQSKHKPFLISETGWSAEGVNVNASVASAANQVHFFKDFYHQAIAHDFQFYYYTSFDTHWRVVNPDDAVEATFGLFQDDRGMKSWFQAMQIGSRDQKMVRSAVDATLLLSERGGEVALVRDTGDAFGLEQGSWLLDTDTFQLRNKGSDTCLDAYQAWNGGAVHVWACLANEPNQKWTYNAGTGQLMHRSHTGLCLSTSGENTMLATCDAINKQQQWLVQAPSAGCSAVQRNTDYAGNDIGSAPSLSVDGCCALCRSRTGCGAFTWSDYLGGMCWLKSAKGASTSKSGVHSGVVSSSATPTPSPSCPPVQPDTDFIGNDIGSGPSTTPEGCCAICQGQAACKAYSWSKYLGGTCWLKSGTGTVVSTAGVYSASFSLSFSSIQDDVDYAGNDLSHTSADGAAKCVNLCTATTQCMAFTWTKYNGGTCWLKTAKGTARTVVGARSAYRS